MHTGVDPRHLAAAAADIAQLTQPIHIAHRGSIHTHPPLLHQLADAAQPGNSPHHGPERHPKPGSRPAANLEAITAYADLVDEVATWLRTTAARTPAHERGSLRWCHDALHALIGVMPDLAPSLAAGAAQAIHEWWRTAATTVGWRTSDLEKLR
jgi:hypothetical protein